MGLTASQLNHVGIAARRLLLYAWTRPSGLDPWFAQDALRAVCQTFASNPVESADLIRKVLAPTHMTRWAWTEMVVVAHEIGQIVGFDPVLVEDVYRAAFTHLETSTEATHLGGGNLFALQSTRRQDYGSALFNLVEAFPTFLAAAPQFATRALIDALTFYVHNEVTSPLDVSSEDFELSGRQASIKPDQSTLRLHDGNSPRDNPVGMLEALGRYLLQIAADPGSASTIDDILAIIAATCNLALVWKYLLVWGASAPASLGGHIRALAWALPILSGLDTTVEAGTFITAVYDLLAPAERAKVEHAILSIPSRFPPDRREGGQHIRDRLLGCVPANLITTNEARSVIQDLAALGGPPANHPLIGNVQFSSREVLATDWLATEGVSVDAEPNRAIQALVDPVDTFVKHHDHVMPTMQDVEAIVSTLQSLHAGLHQSDAHPMQIGYGWAVLASACERITHIPDLCPDTAVGSFIESALLAAAQQPTLAHTNPGFDEHPSWGQDPRISAAAGLPVLARLRGFDKPAVLATIEELSRDLEAAVRFQIARRLYLICESHPDVVWPIIESLCRDEESNGVLSALFPDTIPRLAYNDYRRAVDLVQIIYNRVQDGPGARDVRDACLATFTDIYLWRDDDCCRTILHDLADAAFLNADDVRRTSWRLSRRLAYGPVAPSEAGKDEERLRAISLFERITRIICLGLHATLEQYADTSVNDWPEETRDGFMQGAGIARDLAHDLYLGSGAFRPPSNDVAEPDLTPEQRIRFLRELETVMDDLADLPLMTIAHDVLQTLEYLIPVDPATVFRKVGHVVEVNQNSGYQYEPMAGSLVVQIVQRYFAEYRHIFRDDDELQRTLVGVLDTFVLAGWPEAIALTYQIGDIYR